MKEYERANVKVAKMLRGNMTRHEKKLWYDYLSKYPVRFQRQKPIGNYIADFYCAKAQLIIELDGCGHFWASQAKRDEERTAELEKLGCRVLRIRNTQIDENFRMVCEMIDHEVMKSMSQPENSNR